MTKTKSTKRALLMSALSLLLCVSMLIGSTFAWFTDSVSSMNNIIKSGNLDVELKYYDGDSWEKVTADTNVFDENALWEPGHTEVVYLEVSNLGTLALKYNLGVNIVSEIESINVAGEAFRLSDFIEFGVVENVSTPYADRAAARDAVTDAEILSTGYTKSGSIEAGADAQYVALVVYMPETVDNDANYRTGEVAPEITLGINLMATQYTSESDSFDNQYDANAKYDGIPAARTTLLAAMPTVSTVGGNNVTLDTAYVFNTTETPDAAQMNAKRYWHADFVATFDKDVDDAAIGLAGQYDAFSTDWLAFELDGIGDIAANTPVRMLEFAGISINYEELCEYVKQFRCGAFAVDQAAMEGTTMTVELRLYETTKDANATSGTANEETGEYITIGTYSYTFGAKKVADAATLADAIANGDDIALAADIALADDTFLTVADGASANIDLNGYTLSGTSEITGKNRNLITVKGDLTVSNGSVVMTHTGDNMGWNNLISAFSVEGGELTLDGVTINASGSDMAYGVDVNTTLGETVLNINDSVINSSYTAVRIFNNHKTATGTVNLNSGSVNGGKRDIWAQMASSTSDAANAIVNIAAEYTYEVTEQTSGGKIYQF